MINELKSTSQVNNILPEPQECVEDKDSKYKNKKSYKDVCINNLDVSAKRFGGINNGRTNVSHPALLVKLNSTPSHYKDKNG